LLPCDFDTRTVVDPSIDLLLAGLPGGNTELFLSLEDLAGRKNPSSSHRRIVSTHLPIQDVEYQIMERIHNNDTVILVGETGCGKSTQVPQYCVRIGLARNGRIGVTQPRRLAALSLADRVASEMNTSVGQQVGYHVRFEKQISKTTQISYLTDGILLREAIHDPLLREYNTIIVDEAHERSLHTDVLLSEDRNESNLHKLRIIIMSATLEAKLFSWYFNDAPVFIVKGRTFPVEVFHAQLNPENSDYVFNSLVCIKDLHQQEPLCDHFLVFLTGREEIECAAKKLRELNQHFENPIYPVPLFAALSSVAQLKAFEPPPVGHRKVVLATNIAETSLTIPGVRVVIDSGKVKTRYFTASDRIDVLRVHDVSKAQAIQRTGRAGREAPGKCYRLYPFQHFEKLELCSVPEILRSNLSAVLLELLALGLRRPRKLKLIQQPDQESLVAAERELLVSFFIYLVWNKVFAATLGYIPAVHFLLVSWRFNFIESSTFRQALACGLFMNVCEYDRQEDRYRLLVKPSTTLKVHPSSGLSRVGLFFLPSRCERACSHSGLNQLRIVQKVIELETRRKCFEGEI
uniref:RNA helicase n=1 Tax=Angiostrongylus cantonensis TaxID=6313 RepID=A0A0K0D9S9_ANGCA